jgi:hypothetical protein
MLLFITFGQRAAFQEVFEASLRAQTPDPITFHEAYLELPPGDQASYLQSQADTLRRRYSGLKLDVVVVNGPSALSSPSIPRHDLSRCANRLHRIGHSAIRGNTSARRDRPDHAVGLGETIDLALRLHPDATTVAVVRRRKMPTGWRQLSGAASHQHRIGGPPPRPPSRELFQKVVALPGRTVVLFHLAPPMSGQPPLAGLDLIDAVAERMPTYSAWRSLCLGHGCIGGAYGDTTKETVQLAAITARLLGGEHPDSIPVVSAASLTVDVD